jgi:hypothetical protein
MSAMECLLGEVLIVLRAAFKANSNDETWNENIHYQENQSMFWFIIP